jgi:hypothetical protein
MAYKNPLFYNQFFKTEKHNSTNPLCRIYEKGIEQMLNIYGYILFYYPISEYDMNGITQLWGEDINKEYLEKYTLSGITDGENDTFVFNRFGVDKSNAERIVYISRKQFTEATGRDEPLEGDMFQWTQNKIIYEITEVTDQEHIVLGSETTWKLIAIPRMVEGEVFGFDDCDSTREDIVDVGETGTVTECDQNEAPDGDGDNVSNPDVHVPGPSTHIIDDEEVIDDEKDSPLIRNSWGNWD